MKNIEVNYLFGNELLDTKPFEVYSENVCCFLDALSKKIRQDAEAKKYKDIQTFAFWIRKAHLSELKKSCSSVSHRIGRGMVFHIAPSNVPINFAYTFVFGLLSGNSNIIKVSSKKFKQVMIICRILKEMVKAESFTWIQKQNAIVVYERDNYEATNYFSSICDMRIIWGGDKTIETVRKSPLQPHSTEITFADRYSIALISIDAVQRMSAQEMNILTQKFYNDTYLMDQNACSSPQIIFWLGDQRIRKDVEEKFWESLYQQAKKYDLEDVKVSEKYSLLCEYAAKLPITRISKYENILYVVYIDEMIKNITELRGKFGLFFSRGIVSLADLKDYVNNTKIQTCAIYGISPKEIQTYILSQQIQGIDRIVPIGNTLDIEMIWDGYDVISNLSRMIKI